MTMVLRHIQEFTQWQIPSFFDSGIFQPVFYHSRFYNEQKETIKPVWERALYSNYGLFTMRQVGAPVEIPHTGAVLLVHPAAVLITKLPPTIKLWVWLKFKITFLERLSLQDLNCFIKKNLDK